MKTKRPLSSIFLVLQGILLIGLGLYFVFVHPPLLPEDPRFMGTSLAGIQSAIPGLLIWLRGVFWVMGGFMFTSGLLVTYIAMTEFAQPTRIVRAVISLTSLTSIGWMAIVNFMINSDFKWLLLAFNLPWILGLIASRKQHALPSHNESI